MRKRWLLAGVILLLLSWLLVGCGVAQEQYDAVVADLNSAQGELQSARAELQSVKGDLSAAQAKVSELTSSLENSQNELQSTQADLKSTQADLESAGKKLTAIEEVYPPRNFSSLKELQDWLRANDVSERPASTNAENVYSKALEIQEDALKDGYIISAGIVDLAAPGEFLITLVTVIDGDVFMWNPETDEVTDYSGLTNLLKVR